ENAGPGRRALLMILLSILLLTLDHCVHAFQNQRLKIAATIAYPFQIVVDTPIRMAHWLSLTLTAQRDLLRENEMLRVRQVLLQAEVQKLLALEQENAALRKLLQSTS